MNQVKIALLALLMVGIAMPAMAKAKKAKAPAKKSAKIERRVERKAVLHSDKLGAPNKEEKANSRNLLNSALSASITEKSDVQTNYKNNELVMRTQSAAQPVPTEPGEKQISIEVGDEMGGGGFRGGGEMGLTFRESRPAQPAEEEVAPESLENELKEINNPSKFDKANPPQAGT